MKQNIKRISTHELLPVVHEIIQSGRKAIITVSGNSMRPLIVNNRDKAILRKMGSLKKGDIVLFKNNDGEYILHRICRIRNNKYETIGDYCTEKDGLVAKDDIIAVAEAVIRKGRKIPCDSLIWRLFSYLWLALLPLRKYLIVMYQLNLIFKAGIKRGMRCFIYQCMAVKEDIGLFLKRRGWLSEHD